MATAAPESVRHEADRLIDAGVHQADIARALGAPLQGCKGLRVAWWHRCKATRLQRCRVVRLQGVATRRSARPRGP